MKTQPASKLLPLLCVLVATALAVAVWLFLGDTPAGEFHSVEAATTTTEHDQARPASSLAPLPAAEAGAAATPSTAAPDKAAERETAATLADLELAGGLWVSGRVVYPEGTPIDEEVHVVATGRKFKSLPMHRARVEPNGNFRVAFAPGTKSGRISVEGRYLYLDGTTTVKLADGKAKEELVLEPKLGGCLRGQLILPPAASGLASELVGKSLNSHGWDSDYGNSQQRVAKLDEALRFELRGLSPKIEHSLTFDSDVVATLTVEDQRFEAGKAVARDFLLTQGVRLRGKVTCTGGSLPKSVELSIYSTTGEEALSRLGAQELYLPSSGDSTSDTATVGPDGSFDARGIVPGKITLAVAGEQRVPAELKVGDLVDGDVREGLELALGMGSRLAGNVLWPDGRPAVDAKVQVQAAGDEAQQRMPWDSSFLVRTNAEGAFVITGLSPGNYKLLAQAKPAEADPSSKARPQSWKATLPEVAADTLDLRLVLVGGYSVSGSVVDDAGAPLKRFRIHAGTGSEPGFDFQTAASSPFSGEDGRFELPGLLEGTYMVGATASGHEPSDPIQIEIPGTASELNFVLARRAGVAGTVVKPDGSPAAKAEVSVVPAGEESWNASETRTNARGEFRVKSVAAGNATIRAELEGFAASEAWQLQLSPGGTAEGVRLVLRKGGQITGQLIASRAGEELGGRDVEAHCSEGEGRGSTTTDDSGRFHLDSLEPGEYTVTVGPTHAQVQALTAGREDNDWELRNALSKHAQASVTDGGSTHVTIGTPARAAIALAGVVRRGNQPVAGVRVCSRQRDDYQEQDVRFAMTDGTGRYELAVNGAGDYELEVQPNGMEGTRISRAVNVPESGLKNADFTLPIGRIAGKVILPEGGEGQWTQASLEYHGGALPQGAVSPMSKYESNSSFEFTDLPAGRYTLKANSSSWQEDREEGVASREVVLGEGEQLVGLELRLGAAGRIAVQVVGPDAASVVEGWLQVRRVGQSGASHDWEHFSQGAGEIESLEAGVYEITAQTENHISSTERVEVLAGQSSALTLRLRAAGSLTFNPLDSAGQPTAATAQAYDGQGRAVFPTPLPHGETATLPPGSYRIVGTNSAGASQEVVAEVRAGETAVVELVFQ